MRVLHVIVGLNVGGDELMLKRLVDSGTPNNEIQHSVIPLTDLRTLGPKLQAIGVPISAIVLLAITFFIFISESLGILQVKPVSVFVNLFI